MDRLVLSSAEFIASVSTHVRLGDDSHFQSASATIGPLVRAWSPTSWSHSTFRPTAASTAATKAAWIFLIDTLNFAFWTPDGRPPFTVLLNGLPYTGYRALCAALKRASDRSLPILDPSFWADSTAADWLQIFRSDSPTPVPLFESRVTVVNEAGRFLIGHFNGSVYEMIRSCENSAAKIVDLVRLNLESYRDECDFKGRKVYFLKRAQILAADLHFGLLAEDDPVCSFRDIGDLTMFADYRVPQGLNYFGLIVYSEWLIAELKERPHLDAGSEIECEIRGVSIVAVEKLKLFIGEPAISVLVDYAIWDYTKANEQAMAHIPIHKTSGIFY
jgi:hypothetical protein